MSIMIKVSETTEEIIKDKARQNGKAVSQFLGEFVEDSFSNRRVNGDQPENGDISERPFMRMMGMFSSGIPDTSERMDEILYSDDLDPAQGFGTDK